MDARITKEDRECAERCIHVLYVDPEPIKYPEQVNRILPEIEAHVAPIRAKLDQAVGLLRWTARHACPECDTYAPRHADHCDIGKFLATLPTGDAQKGAGDAN